jgi:hypothetical protein
MMPQTSSTSILDTEFTLMFSNQSNNAGDADEDEKRNYQRDTKYPEKNKRYLSAHPGTCQSNFERYCRTASGANQKTSRTDKSRNYKKHSVQKLEQSGQYDYFLGHLGKCIKGIMQNNKKEKPSYRPSQQNQEILQFPPGINKGQY